MNKIERTGYKPGAHKRLWILDERLCNPHEVSLLFDSDDFAYSESPPLELADNSRYSTTASAPNHATIVSEHEREEDEGELPEIGNHPVGGTGGSQTLGEQVHDLFQRAFRKLAIRRLATVVTPVGVLVEVLGWGPRTQTTAAGGGVLSPFQKGHKAVRNFEVLWLRGTKP
jgi:hypothetical protein